MSESGNMQRGHVRLDRQAARRVSALDVVEFGVNDLGAAEEPVSIDRWLLIAVERDEARWLH